MNIDSKYRILLLVAMGCALVLLSPSSPPLPVESIVSAPPSLGIPTPVNSGASDEQLTESPRPSRESVLTGAVKPRSDAGGYDRVAGIDFARQWETPDVELAAVAHRRFEGRAQPRAGEAFVTSYSKINCGAVVSNMCLWNAQPRYFRAGKQLFTSKGGTLCCNEAGPKQRFFMVMYDPASLVPASDGAGSSKHAMAVQVPGVGGNAIPYETDTVLVVPYCWELYGYHLILCQQATFAAIQRLGLYGLPGRVKLQLAFMRGGTFTSYRAGSNVTWTDDVRRGVPSSVVERSTFWPLWKSVVPYPHQVDALPTSPRRCYGMAVIAGLPSNEVTPTQAMAWREEVMIRLRVTRSRPALACGAFKTLIVQRKEKFFIRDADELKRRVKETIGGEVMIVALEDLSFREQLQLAVDADLLIGIHGNGLTWVTMMKNTSALLELWPNNPYNANYYHLATRANVKLFSSTGDGTCGQRCSANFVPGLMKGKLTEIRSFLDDVHCHGKVYDASAQYMRERAEIKAKKEAKRRAKNAS